MFHLCRFLKVTLMRAEDVRVTSLWTGISTYSPRAGTTRVGAGQTPAQTPSCFLPLLPSVCLAWSPSGSCRRRFSCSPCRDALRRADGHLKPPAKLGPTPLPHISRSSQAKGDQATCSQQYEETEERNRETRDYF